MNKFSEILLEILMKISIMTCCGVTWMLDESWKRIIGFFIACVLIDIYYEVKKKFDDYE